MFNSSAVRTRSRSGSRSVPDISRPNRQARSHCTTGNSNRAAASGQGEACPRLRPRAAGSAQGQQAVNHRRRDGGGKERGADPGPGHAPGRTESLGSAFARLAGLRLGRGFLAGFAVAVAVRSLT